MNEVNYAGQINGNKKQQSDRWNSAELLPYTADIHFSYPSPDRDIDQLSHTNTVYIGNLRICRSQCFQADAVSHGDP